MKGQTVSNILKLSITSLLIIAGSAFYYQSSLLVDRSSYSSLEAPQQHYTHTRSDSISMKSSTHPWTPTRSKEILDPEVLCNSKPQMAKDVDFGQAVISKWNEDVTQMKSTNTYWEAGSETKLFEYQDSADGKTLYGHLLRTQQEKDAATKKKVPGILLFHTGAGPHDISLLWKADLLACNKDIFPDGCVILVTDILSDDSGWGWGADRTKYSDARTKVLKPEGRSGERPLLQSRIRAAIKGLQEAAPEVDMNQLSALGWCLGGHSILELGRMKIPGMKAMVTFHGVFDGVPPPETGSMMGAAESVADILICNGQLDPFVDQDTVLRHAIDTLQHLGHNVRLLQLEGAKHGFTNPAQDFNPNQAFRYNAEAAELSWSEANALLKKIFK